MELYIIYIISCSIIRTVHNSIRCDENFITWYMVCALCARTAIFNPVIHAVIFLTYPVSVSL